jgi:hypothetical protein
MNAAIDVGEVSDTSGSSFANAPHGISESSEHCVASFQAGREPFGHKKNSPPANVRSRFAQFSEERFE